MWRIALVTLIFAPVGAAGQAAAAPVAVVCDDRSTAELTVDGLLEDWTTPVLAIASAAMGGDRAVIARCAQDDAAAPSSYGRAS